MVGLCGRVFVITSSILALHPNQAHQYIRIVKTKRMVKTVFSNFICFSSFEIYFTNNYRTSILVLNGKQTHESIRPIGTNKIFILFSMNGPKGIKYIWGIISGLKDLVLHIRQMSKRCGALLPIGSILYCSHVCKLTNLISFNHINLR